MDDLFDKAKAQQDEASLYSGSEKFFRYLILAQTTFNRMVEKRIEREERCKPKEDINYDHIRRDESTIRDGENTIRQLRDDIQKYFW